MTLSSTLLILAIVGLPSTQPRHPDAVEIFDCKFDDKWDVNYDRWPDKWRRQLGPGLPHYVDVSIGPDAEAPDNSCLTVHVNGGGAHLETPLISVSDKFSYKVEARLRVADLHYSKAQVRVEFLDDDGAVLQSSGTDWLPETNGWMQVNLGPVNPEDEPHSHGPHRAARRGGRPRRPERRSVAGRRVDGAAPEDDRDHRQRVQRLHQQGRHRRQLPAVGHPGQ